MTSEYVNPEDEVQHFLDQFEGLNDEQKEALTNDFSNFVEAWVRYRYLPRAKQFIKPRILSNGNPVTTDSSGVTRDLKNTSVGDTLNFVGGVVNINASNPRQFDIQMAGGGDCMFNFLVSSCFASLAGFTEGQTFTTVSGCTYKGYSTWQGVQTWLDTSSAASSAWTVYLCGITSENVTITYGGSGGGWNRLYVYGSGMQHSGITGTLSLNGTEGSTFDTQFFDLAIQTAVSNDGGGNNKHPRFYRCNLPSVVSPNAASTVAFSGIEFHECVLGTLTASGPGSWVNTVVSGCTVANINGGTSGIAGKIVDNWFNGVSSLLTLWASSHTAVVGNRWATSGAAGTPAIKITGSPTNNTFGLVIDGNIFANTPAVNQTVIQLVSTGSMNVDMTVTGNTFAYGGSNGSVSFINGDANTAIIASITGNTFESNNTTPNFLENDGGISVIGKFIYSTFGPNTPSNFKVQLLTGSSNNLYIGLGTVTGTGATLLPQEHHVISAQVDVTVASTTVPYQVVGPMPAAGTITGVEAKSGENKTNGATSSIFDVHKVLAANANTDGQGTTIFTTQANRPTIVNGAMLSTTTAPDVTAFAAGDYFAIYTDQSGTTLTVANVGIKFTIP